ncbi:MAG: DUF4920 domain-containing protein [Saprospiraceae bacterium]|jgi:hypothetical protein|nr:DUF4920 domain-containing protein [Saprospiraceae bacterium]MBP9208722.1 DUF4920 domain-containing protein [Saprospiraceae bacterium]MBV6472280.1 hypothetical protein [Saprospiraceae bacterium]
MKTMSFATGLLLFFAACKTDPRTTEEVAAPPAPQALAFYGDTIATDSAKSVDETLRALEQSDSLFTKVTGYVTSVCQAKGCWMVLSQSPDDSTGIFVKFKDYGFFVPLDFAGSRVVIEGKAYREVTSVEELRHYAEDEGKPQEEIDQITEPAEEMKFMASGVALLESPTGGL